MQAIKRIKMVSGQIESRQQKFMNDLEFTIQQIQKAEHAVYREYTRI